MPLHVLRHWERFRAEFCREERWVLLADFDGTLTPIVRSPDRARLSSETWHLLWRLSRHPQVCLGIVSGRALADIQRLIHLPRIIYVGNHGFEIIGPGMHFVHPEARRIQPLLHRLTIQLCRALSNIRGSYVEFKGFSLSLHYRQVSPRTRVRFQTEAERILEPWLSRKRIRVTYGKCVLEVRPPVAWDKGKGVSWIVQHLSEENKRLSRVIYLGDDRTDEDAFRVVNRLQGLSVFVGRHTQRTQAHGYLVGPGEVRLLLRRLLADVLPRSEAQERRIGGKRFKNSRT